MLISFLGPIRKPTISGAQLSMTSTPDNHPPVQKYNVWEQPGVTLRWNDRSEQAEDLEDVRCRVTSRHDHPITVQTLHHHRIGPCNSVMESTVGPRSFITKGGRWYRGSSCNGAWDLTCWYG